MRQRAQLGASTVLPQPLAPNAPPLGWLRRRRRPCVPRQRMRPRRSPRCSCWRSDSARSSCVSRGRRSARWLCSSPGRWRRSSSAWRRRRALTTCRTRC
eukprot:jgi/Chrpa1/6004/Chrysochromulina_OHIO_Genome00008897-RA